MIIKNGTNERIEKIKQKLNLTGDVYLIKDTYIESLESHKKLNPNSTATTIEEAEEERLKMFTVVEVFKDLGKQQELLQQRQTLQQQIEELQKQQEEIDAQLK
jgi:hypothetical protein